MTQDKTRSKHGRLWILKIFAREFGFSDLLSNYSRTYSWMANQLGHMTLGLGVAFLFVWIVETVGVAIEVWPDHPATMSLAVLIAVAATVAGMVSWIRNPVREWILGLFNRPIAEIRDLLVLAGGSAVVIALALSATPACELCSVNAGLLAVTVHVLAAAALTGLGLALRPRPGDADVGRLTLRRTAWFGARARRIGAVAVAALVAAGLWHASAMPAAPEQRTVFGAVLAGAVFAAALLTLAKDWRFFAIGLVTLLGAVSFASGGLGTAAGHGPVDLAPMPLLTGTSLAFTLHPEAQLGAAIALVFVALTHLLLVECRGIGTGLAPAPDTDRPAPETRWTFLAMAAGTGLLLVWATNGVVEDRWVPNVAADWRLPIAAGTASVAIWWLKEFGSDLPNVDREIAEARQRRDGEGLEALRRDYFMDGAWDARTDAAFYVTGAAIAVGVLSDGTLLSAEQPGRWAVGAEIIGLLGFVAAFLAFGRLWAYRQQALDLTGAPRANRVAVLGHDLALHILGGPAATRGTPCPDPHLVLHDFARGCVRAGSPGTGERAFTAFTDLVVIDRTGGRGRIGEALVSEASLRHLRTGLLVRIPEDEMTWRRGRIIDFAELQALSRRIRRGLLSEADIAFTPTRPLRTETRDDGTRRRRVIRAADACPRDGEGEDLPVANLVAVRNAQIPIDVRVERAEPRAPENWQIAGHRLTVTELVEANQPEIARNYAEAVEGLAPARQCTVWVLEVWSEPGDDAARAAKAEAERGATPQIATILRDVLSEARRGAGGDAGTTIAILFVSNGPREASARSGPSSAGEGPA